MVIGRFPIIPFNVQVPIQDNWFGTKTSAHGYHVEVRMTRQRSYRIAIPLFVLTICSCQNKPHRQASYWRTLRSYASEARAHGAREALVPYAVDEEEGEMLEILTFDDALLSYEWIVGEPIGERTFGVSTITNSDQPDSIYTAYRVRVEKRFGRSMNSVTLGPFETRMMSEIDRKSTRLNSSH